MYIIIQPKKDQISRMLLRAIAFDQEAEVKDGKFVILSETLDQSFLGKVINEFDGTTIKLTKTWEEKPNIEDNNPKPTEDEKPKKGNGGRKPKATTKKHTSKKKTSKAGKPEENKKKSEEIKDETKPKPESKKGDSKGSTRNANNLPTPEDLSQIPEILDFIKNGVVDNISITKLFKIPERQETKFTQLLNLVAAGESIERKAVEAKFKEMGSEFNTYDRKICGDLCKAYFAEKGYYLPFQKFLLLYQNESKPSVKPDDPQQNPDVPVPNPETKDEDENKKNEETKPVVATGKKGATKKGKGKATISTIQTRAETGLYHLRDISEFDQAIQDLNPNATREEAAEQILSVMHYRTHLDKDAQESLFVMTCIALALDEVDWDIMHKMCKKVQGYLYIDQEAKSTAGRFVHNYFNEKGYQCTYIYFLQLLAEATDANYLGQLQRVNFNPPTGTVVKAEDLKPKNRIKLEHMPAAPDFEEFLGSLDKEEPVKENLEKILEYMGISDLPDNDQEMLSEVVNVAFNTMDPTLDVVFEELGITSTIEATQKCSAFINKFAKKYDKAVRIKFMDFIGDLQNSI